MLKEFTTFPNQTDLIWRLVRNHFRIGKIKIDKEQKLFVSENCLDIAKKGIKIETINVVFKTRIYGESKWKNNLFNFINHILFNLLYLYKLRFTKI